MSFAVKLGFKNTRHTGIVIVQRSSLIREDAAERCLEAGADDFIDRKASPREVNARFVPYLGSSHYTTSYGRQTTNSCTISLTILLD